MTDGSVSAGREPGTVEPSTSGLLQGHPSRQVLVPLHLVGALLLGVVADVGLGLSVYSAFVFTAATPWVLLVFSSGRASGLLWSPVVGAGTLLVGLAAYYSWLLLGRDVAAGTLTGSGYSGWVWLGVGAVVGAVAGVLGALTRHRSFWPEFVWSGAIAVPVVEAFLQLSYDDVPALGATLVWGGVALGMSAWAWRAGVRMWAMVVGTPLACIALWNLEVAVLQLVFGRLTWI